MDLAVLIPLACYVLLSFVGVRAATGGVTRSLVIWTAFLVAAALVLTRLPAVWFYPKNEALRATQSELFRLREKPLRRGDVVLLVQGSSAVSAAVKPRLLERLLRERKLPARVFLLSVPGSNHFERLELLRQWLAQLTPAQRDALRAARVVALREILMFYDEAPLHGFAENALGDRSIASASAENLGPMLETVWRQRRATDPAESPPSSLFPLIATHFLFNAFRVGTIPMIPSEADAYSALGPRPAPRKPRPAAGAPPTVTPPRARGFDLPAALAQYHAQIATPRAAAPPDFPWMAAPERALSRVTAGTVDGVAWLATPHIVAKPRRYEQRALAAHADALVRLDGGADAVLALLDRPEFWRDGVHLTPAGGDIFTRWLADQIAAAWPQIAGPPAGKEGR